MLPNSVDKPCFSNLKTSFSGSFHALRFEKYADRYSGAFSFRSIGRFIWRPDGCGVCHCSCQAAENDSEVWEFATLIEKAARKRPVFCRLWEGRRRPGTNRSQGRADSLAPDDRLQGCGPELWSRALIPDGDVPLILADAANIRPAPPAAYGGSRRADFHSVGKATGGPSLERRRARWLVNWEG